MMVTPMTEAMMIRAFTSALEKISAEDRPAALYDVKLPRVSSGIHPSPTRC